MSNIVITGANQGIGYYFVEQALKNGNKVAVLDIKTDKMLIQKALKDWHSYFRINFSIIRQMYVMRCRYAPLLQTLLKNFKG